jgi:putative endonuclease
MKPYYVYIATNHNETLYIGVTNSLERRMFEHATGTPGSFSSKYRIHSLLYYEVTTSPLEAIAREKQLKGWRRDKKLALIDKLNPHWYNLLDRPFDYAQGDDQSKRLTV